MSKFAAILGVSALVLSTSAMSAEPVAPEGTEMATSMFADPVPNEKVDVCALVVLAMNGLYHYLIMVRLK